MARRLTLTVEPRHRVRLPGGRTEMAALMKVAGLTLLERAIWTGQRAGCDGIRVVVEGRASREIRELVHRKRLPVQLARKKDAAGKTAGSGLTIPSNWIFDQNALQWLSQRDDAAPGSEMPKSAEVFLHEIRTEADARRAERALYRYRSGKNTDGVHTRLMKRFLARPLTWLLLRTPLTPNMISILGLLVAVISGFLFARGGYFNVVLGALVFYLASALDHCDGAVARLKFKESAFGCWLDSISDYLSYASLYTGLTIGLYRTSGNHFYLYSGLTLAVGALLTFGIVSAKRRNVFPENPEEWHFRVTSKLSEKSSHPLYAAAKYCSFLTRRSAVALYLVLFAVFDLSGLFLVLSTLALNLIWIAVLAAMRLFRAPAGLSTEESW